MNLKLPSLLGCCLLVATAYHNYGGRCEELNNIQQKRPDKELVFTETSIGMWNDERNQERRLMEDMREGGCKGADVKGKTPWFDIIKPAGTATLTCYIIPYIWYAAQQLLGWHYPELLNAGAPGLLRSLIFSLIIVQLTGLLVKAKIKLKV